MQVRHWLPPVILLGTALIAVWATMRLMNGRPRWNSLFAVGRPGVMSPAMLPAPGFYGPGGRHHRHRRPAPNLVPPGPPAAARPPAGPPAPAPQGGSASW